MKKHLLSAVLLNGVFVLGGATVYAADSYDKWQNLKWTSDVVRFNPGCYDNTHSTKGEHCGRVTTFSDNGNRCYVAYASGHNQKEMGSSISCVRESAQ